MMMMMMILGRHVLGVNALLIIRGKLLTVPKSVKSIKTNDFVGFRRYPGTTREHSTCWIDWCYQIQLPD